MAKTANEKIKYFQYRRIESDFYEVYGVTDFDKIAIEGNVCSGVLLKLMEQVKNDKGKTVRVKGREEFDFISGTKKIQHENNSLKKELKKYKEKFTKLKRLTK